MKIQKHDLYHGAALAQIVKHRSFKAINRASAKYGHYVVNTNRYLFVKYTAARRSPWRFLLHSDEIEGIKAEVEKKRNYVYLCLVCGRKTICALKRSEIKKVIDLSSDIPQWIQVKSPKGGRCHVCGSNGSLKYTVPHSSFPDKVIG